MAISLDLLQNNVPTLADKVLFVAVGQGGGNIGIELQNLGYTVFYVNTSHRDLETLYDKDGNEVAANRKYHFAGEDGCNKDRTKAKLLAKSHSLRLSKLIADRFSDFTNICFVYSMGGGSGSGITPILMKILSNFEELEDKVLMSMAIVPNKKEPPKVKINAVECFNDFVTLYKSNVISSSLWVSNPEFSNGSNKLEFNREVAYDVHRILNISSKDVRGTIDQYEALDQLGIRGAINIGDIIKGRKGDRDRFEVSYCFEQAYGAAQSIVYSLTDETDYIRKIMENSYGEVEIPLVGYRDDDMGSYAVVYGLPIPSDVFDEYHQDYKDYRRKQEQHKTLETSVRSIDIDIPINNPRKQRAKTKAINTTADLDDLFSDLL